MKRDRRVERTRRAILDAFRELVLTRGYDAISVRDIVETAGVGRSTFYEHFDDKDGLFQASLHPLLSVLAEAIGDGPHLERLQMVIAHFGHNRRLARIMLAGPGRRLMARFLSELIENRLMVMARQTRGAKPMVPLRLIATHLAEAQLGLIEAWMFAKVACAPEAVAHALQASASASAAALLARKAA
ncbi:MAG TPA: helix-turn-helix domain-containing protein [Candidatus Elarobacter sp.]